MTSGRRDIYIHWKSEAEKRDFNLVVQHWLTTTADIIQGFQNKYFSIKTDVIDYIGQAKNGKVQNSKKFSSKNSTQTSRQSVCRDLPSGTVLRKKSNKKTFQKNSHLPLTNKWFSIKRRFIEKTRKNISFQLGRRVRLMRTNLPVEGWVSTDRSMVAALLAYNTPTGT